MTEPIVSGTRLKGKYIRGADGARTYLRGVLYDSQLRVDCSYRLASDSALRCLPVLVPATVVFKDSNCTEGVVSLTAPPSGCPADTPSYVLDFDSPPYCSQAKTNAEVPARVYPVGALLGTISGTLYRKDATGPSCTQTNPPPGGVWYSLDAEILPDKFVAGTATVRP